jgi:hypothetical protein
VVFCCLTVSNSLLIIELHRIAPQYALGCRILGDADCKGQLSVEITMSFSGAHHSTNDLIHYGMHACLQAIFVGSGTEIALINFIRHGW